MSRSAKSSPGRLPALFHHRWSIPLLAELERAGGGAKFVTLARRTGAPRDSLKRALQALVETRLVRPNPGYGHPMRPEYVLSPAGRRAAPACRTLLEVLERLDLAAMGLRKWSMPVVHAASAGASRFRALQAEIAPVTPRALTLALKELVEAGLLTREVSEGHPPSVIYRLTAPARRLVPALESLARS